MPQLTIKDYKGEDREVHVIAWPGTDRLVGLMLLHCDELQAAHFDARKRFRDKGQDVDEHSELELTREEQLQLCYRMLIDPEARVPAARIFKSPNEARARLSPDERQLFVGEHIRLQTEKVEGWRHNLANPHVRAIADLLGLDGPEVTADDVVRAVAELAEGRGA